MRKMLAFATILLVLGANAPAAAEVSADGDAATIKFRQDNLTIQTTGHKSIPFVVEIADTDASQKLGLMHRISLAENHGMLFVFDQEANISMWMKDTPLSLDMIFIDRHGKIVHVARNTTPNSTKFISARKKVKAVLEIGAGVAKKDGIKAGDHVIYPVFEP